MKTIENELKFPLKLQFFAEDPGNDPEGNKDPNSGDGDPDNGNTPTVEELMTQLSKERAEKERLKFSFDKTSSELANAKKQLKERLTAEEQEAEAKREREEEHKKYVTGLEVKLKTIDATKRYMGIGMEEKLAEETAAAEIEGDFEKVTENMRKHQEALVKAREAEWLKNRPDINAGNGDGDNKDPFLEGFNS